MLLVPFAQIGVSIYPNILSVYLLYLFTLNVTLVVHHKLTVEHSVHFHTTVSFYASRTCSSTISLASSKNRHNLKSALIIAPVNIWLSNATSISRQTRDLSLRFAYPPPTCMKRHSNYIFASASRAILFTTDCLCPTARREA